MKIPSDSPFRKALDIGVVIALCLLPFTFVFGLPWLDWGLWPQVEGPSAAMHVLAAFLSLFIGIQMSFSDKRYIAAAKSPVVVAMAVFAAFSILVLPFSDDPMRSLHGTLKHGVGIIWHVELAVVTLAAMAVWTSHRARLALGMSTVAAAFAVMCMYMFPNSPFGLPLTFEKWVGIYALAAAGVLVSIFSSWTGTAVAYGLAAVLMTFGYVVSGDRAAFVAAAVVICFKFFPLIPGFRKISSSPSLRAALVVIVSVVGTIGVYASAPIIERHALLTTPPRDDIASVDPLDRITLQNGTLGTIWSRSYMVRILVDEMIDHPSTALTGNGFGYFGTAYEYHAREVPGRRFPNETPTSSRTYWDVHDKANFHSHNMLMEMTTSTGLIGAILWLAIFAAAAYASAPGAAMALGIAVVGTFWFPINYMMAPLALLFAARSGHFERPVVVGKILPGLSPLIAILLSSILAYSGISAGMLARAEYFERGFSPVEIEGSDCGFMKAAFFPKNEIVIDLYTILRRKILASQNPPATLFASTTNLLSINCMLRSDYEHPGSIRTLTASLEGRSPLIAMGPASYGPMRDDIVKWGDDIALLLKMSPERTEFLPPYVTIVAARAHDKSVAYKAIERFLPMLKQSDPVREYLLAQLALLDADKRAYADHFKKALELGYADLWLVPKSQADEIRGAVSQ